MTTKKSIGILARRATDGLLGSATDTILYLTYLTYSMAGKHTSYEIDRAFEEAKQLLGEINYKTIKRAIAYLVTEGLLERSQKKSVLEIAITKKGRERIAATIPAYQKDRPWDGYLYLVSYDIPKKGNLKRDLLRHYIRKTGGARLQESLWVHPYNPTHILADFTRINQIPGTVIVSKLGKDGAIGNESLFELISRIYHLEALTNEYQEFIETYKYDRKTPFWKVSVDYFRVLKHDPQIPFELLPKDFPAAVAYKIYKSHAIIT